jgi:hypothetical protein
MKDIPNMNDPLASIDRLATGDLSEPARHELFAWLDADPIRWRRCALVLLETRELEQTFGEWRTGDPPAAPAAHRPSAAPGLRWHMLTVLAASLLIAFSLGIWARGLWNVPQVLIASSPEAAKPASVPDTNREQRGTAEQTTEPSDTSPGDISGEPEFIPQYVRNQWERRGYHVTSQHVKLPVVLPDGRRLLVPANELQLNYVNQRTY